MENFDADRELSGGPSVETLGIYEKVASAVPASSAGHGGRGTEQMSNSTKHDAVCVESPDSTVPGREWTFLGPTEAETAVKVRVAQSAFDKLNVWSETVFARTSDTRCVSFKTIDSGPATKAQACLINGVEKALSAEYGRVFGVLASDFIAVERALVPSDSKK